MKNELTIKQDGAITFSQDDIKLIRETVCKGADETEFKLFIYQAKKTGLNPLARQIYAVKRWDSNLRREAMAIQVSIDGFRLVAERTGHYAGQVGPFWCGSDGEWKDVWLSSEPPVAAKVGALRDDFKEPCWGVARFDAYAQRKKEGGLTLMWAKMGDVMIAKCAESLALRKAFPQELSGLYTTDEMGQADEKQSIYSVHPEQRDEVDLINGLISKLNSLESIEQFSSVVDAKATQKYLNKWKEERPEDYNYIVALIEETRSRIEDVAP